MEPDIHLFSTVLFVDGNPIGYKVFSNNPDQLFLNPAENPSREIQPPTLSVQNVRGIWTVTGTQNADLIAQVLEDINLNRGLSTNGLSAAP